MEHNIDHRLLDSLDNATNEDEVEIKGFTSRVVYTLHTLLLLHYRREDLAFIQATVFLEDAMHNFRIRRVFRPFFLLQNSTMMKKIVKGIKKTLPQILSILAVLCLHLLLFSVLGMLFFPPFKEGSEGRTDFGRLNNSIINLLVLLTTANNPDGLYCLLNMLTAVIYNQFRGSLLESMQSSYLRRRIGIQAAFEILHAGTCEKTDSNQLSSLEQGRRFFIHTFEPNDTLMHMLKALQNYGSQQLSSSQFHDLMDLYYTEKSNFARVLISGDISQPSRSDIRSLWIAELVCVIKYSDIIFRSLPAPDLEGSWNCIQVVNILVVLRFLAIVFHVKVIYYVFAIIGMELFKDSIPVPTTNERWAQLYFIAWYLVCVIICLNVFIALILEAFITRWDTDNRPQQDDTHMSRLSLHKIFSYIEIPDKELKTCKIANKDSSYSINSELACGHTYEFCDRLTTIFGVT
ncbi:uncharacterized protein TRIADDRAFT_61789 [Trichoplax adhaerens]|uniref:Ion transport domain-containing protein n=1 Tax=Trichoplax adhaerens TaxID=10228 RepID=B3SBZ1_TRIAD|nr:hypothetical protein TRIADDRAFT_61789 [Trichoplax adhaerens]EDV19758.1 hypothetical protein TRIADDRAFT_61789 [Trichoplax adhaerens]|eukprot:XP_002117782.1 hypothetical protein TRIADDRAFT_61789 [Trichoplax adhaerens]